MISKICSKCKQEKPLSEFYKHNRDGYRARCKDCSKEDFNEYNKKTGYANRYMREHSQRPAVKIKNIARWFTRDKVRRGKLTKEPCAFCGKEQVQAHHIDYREPLIIVWLCPDCHRELHQKLKYKGGGGE